jgi:hypothetical protein
MRKSSVILAVVLMSVIALVMAACQPVTVPEAQQEVEEAESALCASIQAYHDSVAALEAVTPETTVEELKELEQASDEAFAAMIEAAAEVQEAEVQLVESAVDELKVTLASIPSDATLGEVSPTIQASAAAVREAVDQLDQVACIEPGGN